MAEVKIPAPEPVGREPDPHYAKKFLDDIQARPDFSQHYPIGINPKVYGPPIQQAYQELCRAGQDIDINTIFTRVATHLLEERAGLKSRGIDTSRVEWNLGSFAELQKFALGIADEPNQPPSK